MGVDDDIARALMARDGELARLRDENASLRAALEEAHCAVGVVIASCAERGDRDSVGAWVDVWKRVQAALEGK